MNLLLLLENLRYRTVWLLEYILSQQKLLHRAIAESIQYLTKILQYSRRTDNILIYSTLLQCFQKTIKQKDGLLTLKFQLLLQQIWCCMDLIRNNSCLKYNQVKDYLNPKSLQNLLFTLWLSMCSMGIPFFEQIQAIQ